MDPIEYWKLVTEYSVIQATLLICGVLPDKLQYEVERDESQQPPGYFPVITALNSAIKSGRINAAIVENDQNGYNAQGLNPHKTMISVAELDKFLRANNFVFPFLIRAGSQTDIPPKREGPNYPTKLAAALKAFNAVSRDPGLTKGKSPKQALEAWLTDNAAELGLLTPAGELNRLAVEEISKVANWKPTGGATPTPGAAPSLPIASVEPTTLPDPKSSPAKRSQSPPPRPLDFDEFPF